MLHLKQVQLWSGPLSVSISVCLSGKLPERRLGMSDVSPLSGISGLSFLSPLLLFSAQSFCSYCFVIFSANGPFSCLFYQKILRRFSLTVTLCCLPVPCLCLSFSVIVLRCVPVQQLWGYECQLPVFGSGMCVSLFRCLRWKLIDPSSCLCLQTILCKYINVLRRQHHVQSD